MAITGIDGLTATGDRFALPAQAYAIELDADGSGRVNVMTPSIIEGTMTYDEVMAGEFSGKLFAKAIKMAQLGVVNPDDMANMIVFLASPECSKVTGQAVSVNGGISAA